MNIWDHAIATDEHINEYRKRMGLPPYPTKGTEMTEEPNIEREGIAACMRLNAKLREELAHYKWRPIAEIHEDYGPCVLMDISDPGYMEVGSNLDTDFDESLWTHFAEVPKLTNEEAARLIQQMNAPKPLVEIEI